MIYKNKYCESMQLLSKSSESWAIVKSIFTSVTLKSVLDVNSKFTNTSLYTHRNSSIPPTYDFSKE
jgi:hypothetical protein